MAAVALGNTTEAVASVLGAQAGVLLLWNASFGRSKVKLSSTHSPEAERPRLAGNGPLEALPRLRFG